MNYIKLLYAFFGEIKLLYLCGSRWFAFSSSAVVVVHDHGVLGPQH
jgi:hypothetical protein